MGYGYGYGHRLPQRRSGAVVIFDPTPYAGLVQDTHVTDVKTSRTGALIDTVTATTGVNCTSSGAARPTYNATGLGSNALPCAVFSASTNLDIAMSQASGDWTMFFVHAPDGITGGGAAQVLLDMQTGRFIPEHISPTDKVSFYHDGSGQQDTTSAAITGAQVLCFRFNSAGATIERNGTALSPTLSYAGRAIGGGQKIGADYTGTSQYFGKIGRILIYSGNLSSADCLAIQRGLGLQYGFTVA